MHESSPQSVEAIVIDEQSVILEAIRRVLVNSTDHRLPVDTDSLLQSIGHHEIKIDEEDQVWLAGIKGKHNPEHILEFSVFSTKPGNDEVVILGWIDLENSVVTDEHGQALSSEQLQDLSDCIIQFPEANYPLTDSDSSPEASISELIP